MDMNNKINRKKFFKWASLALLIPFYKIWQSAVFRNKAFSSSPQTLEIESGLPDGIHFFNRVILIKENDNIKLLSSKCTHLGCKIDKIENGELVCPCHGSRYDSNGSAIKGPAMKSLQEIEYRKERIEGGIIMRFEGR